MSTKYMFFVIYNELCVHCELITISGVVLDHIGGAQTDLRDHFIILSDFMIQNDPKCVKVDHDDRKQNIDILIKI